MPANTGTRGHGPLLHNRCSISVDAKATAGAALCAGKPGLFIHHRCPIAAEPCNGRTPRAVVQRIIIGFDEGAGKHALPGEADAGCRQTFIRMNGVVAK